MELLHVSRVPPVVIGSTASVMDAVQLMAKNEVGAIVIVDENRHVIGIFTERDNMLRVTLKGRDPNTTKLGEVMTAPVATAAPDMNPSEALDRMIRSRYRHLPVVDADNRIVGMASVRRLLMRRVSEQQGSIETLSAYVEAGGPG